ncbi:MAG TPA: phosphotransferase, partial [Pilimelia sp.]|nr:phosphotransferase [Pilimelia sp.]
AVVHGDYRLDNLLVNEAGKIAAVLDWEMSTLGDPLTDIGLLRVYWTAGGGGDILASGGAPLVPVERALEWYEQRSGLDLAPLPWYVAFGNFKLAVILEGIHYRFVHGQTVGEGFERVGRSVAPLVAGGLRALDDL